MMFGNKSKPAHSVRLVQDKSGAPAVDLEKVAAGGHVSLVKRAQKAGISLSKRGLDGVRAEAVLILDHSGSMRSDYRDGTVQALVERALGFALQIDADGKIPVIAFDTRVWPAVEVTVNDYADVVTREIWQPNAMGRTYLELALGQLKSMAEQSESPIFAIVVTDGSPDSRSATTAMVCELARYPVFIKFLAIKPDARGYLQDLDDLDSSKRLLDNVDAKFIPDPDGMSDLEFADAMADEWDTWIVAATSAGVLQS
jgi:hypothetical protein